MCSVELLGTSPWSQGKRASALQLYVYVYVSLHTVNLTNSFHQTIACSGTYTYKKLEHAFNPESTSS